MEIGFPVQFALSVSNRLVVMLFTVTSLIQVGQTEIAERTVVLDEFWHIVAILEEGVLLVDRYPITLYSIPHPRCCRHGVSRTRQHDHAFLSTRRAPCGNTLWRSQYHRYRGSSRLGTDLQFLLRQPSPFPRIPRFPACGSEWPCLNSRYPRASDTPHRVHCSSQSTA